MAELRLPLRRGRRRVAVWLLVGLGLLIFFISPLIGLLAEWPWFSALGYERVFATRLMASFTLGGVAGGVAFAFLYANLRFAQRDRKSTRLNSSHRCISYAVFCLKKKKKY